MTSPTSSPGIPSPTNVKAEEMTEYQCGYRAAVNREPFQQNKSEDWIRGFHNAQLDLSAAELARKKADGY